MAALEASLASLKGGSKASGSKGENGDGAEDEEAVEKEGAA